MRKRQVCAGCLIAAIVLALFPVPAFALTGGSVSQYAAAYFKGVGDAELKPDKITLSDDTIAYALEPGKTSTRADAEYSEYVETNEPYKRGLEIIMQYGYPLNPATEALDADPAAAADKAQYATAIAVQAWSIQNGAQPPAGWADFVSTPDKLTAIPGAEATLEYAKTLMDKAYMQNEMPHKIITNAGTIQLTQAGEAYAAALDVTLENINKGYKMDVSALPTGSEANGYTGNASETISFVIPAEDTPEYKVRLIGSDTRTAANYVLYTPTNQNDASKLIAMNKKEPFTESEVSTLEVTLTKTAVDSSAAPAAAPPAAAGMDYKPVNGSIVVYKKDTDIPLPGAELQITDKNGAVVKTGTTNNSGCVSIADLPSGKYACTQTAAMPGYMLDHGSHVFAVIQSTTGTTYKGDMVLVNDVVRVRIVLLNGVERLEGVTLQMVKRTGEEVGEGTVAGEGTTDANGEVEFSQLENGTYDLGFYSAAEGTSKKTVAALEQIEREINITALHENSNAIYTVDIASLTGARETSTGIEEVRIATMLLCAVSLISICVMAMLAQVDKDKALW